MRGIRHLFAHRSFIEAMVVIGVVAVIGAALLIATHAAVATISIEPEQGTISSGASVSNDAAASGGKYVRFGSSSSGTPMPFGQSGSWTMKFDDEFNGTSLDTTKWSTGWLASGITPPINSAETDCYDPAQVAVSGGSLLLTAIKKTEICGGVSRPYASGAVNSDGKYNAAYGYMEARLQTPAGAGVWPAWWTDGQSWPKDGEIDILEAYGTDESTYHYHYAGCGGDCGPGGSTIITAASTDYHVYAADWESGSITWYYDGKQVWRYATGIVSVPHFLILNLATNKASGVAIPATYKVDYVRVWQH